MNVRRRGFTLIELLAAMAMFAVLLAALYSAMTSGVALRRSAERASEASARRTRLANVLRHDIENAVVPAGILAAALTLESDENDGLPADKLSFTATTGIITDSEATGDLRQISLYLEENEEDDAPEGMVLIRKVVRNPLDTTVDEEEEAASEEQLCEGVESLDITCWDGQDWIESWDSSAQENANPTAVRVRVTFLQDEDEEEPQRPLEVVCLIAQQPRPAPAGAAPASGGGTPP